MCGCTSHVRYAALQDALAEYVKGKDAAIGIAVIIDDTDTVAVNGNREFPMLSVYKFPIALAFADYCRQHNMTFHDSIAIMAQDLHPDTYSPMTERIIASSDIRVDSLKMPAFKLLAYMLQQSDNNASDIILKTTGGPEYVEKYLDKTGVKGIHVKNSEDDMHLDNSLCHANSSTPLAMAKLMDKFNDLSKDSLTLEIKRLIESCETGKNRLAKPLATAVTGHKTGTGFILPDGKIMAVNDAGYVILPDGLHYSVAVFIENSGYDMSQTEELIAEISGIIYSHIKR